jgi:hypothetical protein
LPTDVLTDWNGLFLKEEEGPCLIISFVSSNLGSRWFMTGMLKIWGSNVLREMGKSAGLAFLLVQVLGKKVYGPN